MQTGNDAIGKSAELEVVEHYEKSLGAIHLGGHHMVITTKAALKLTNKYFK